jgi:hypothetical protein
MYGGHSPDYLCAHLLNHYRSYLNNIIRGFEGGAPPPPPPPPPPFPFPPPPPVSTEISGSFPPDAEHQVLKFEADCIKYYLGCLKKNLEEIKTILEKF